MPGRKVNPRTERLCEELALPAIKPEMFCQTLYENLLAENFFGFLDVLYLGAPNRNHLAIAELTRTMNVPLVFAPAAETWARTTVESNICTR